jgi:hypothetical protein
MASPNPADYFVTPSLPTFYVDESAIVIDEKPHLLACAVLAEDNNITVKAIVDLKASLGKKARDELKFNNSGLSRDAKILMSDGVIEIARGCTMFICINEGDDKAALACSVAQQVLDYCVEKGVTHYSLNFDAGFVSNKKELENLVTNLTVDVGPECVGIQHLDSLNDQMIQLSDLFLGLFRLSMQIELGVRQINRLIYREQFEIEEEWSLSDMLLLGTRGHIWGRTKRVLYCVHPEVGEIYHPYHVSFGIGLRVNSTISAETISSIEEKLATTYLGCLD